MKFRLLLFTMLPMISLAQSNAITAEEQKIIEMEKKLSARKELLKLKKIKADKDKELAEIRRKQKELKAKEEAILKKAKEKAILKKAKEEAVLNKAKVVKTVKLQNTLRKRKYYVDGSQLLSLVFKDARRFDSGNSRDFNSHSLSLEAGINLGRFEVGSLIRQSKFDRETFEEKTFLFGLRGIFNFIPNTPENDFIPFAQLTVARISFEQEGVNAFVDNRTEINLAAGFTYFPFSEYLALKTRLTYASDHGTNFESDFLLITSDFLIYF